MNFTVADTVEQRAIELVSNLGREHLFVANCPSDIDADKHASKIITYEEAFDHCDAGVGSCLLLPKALVLRKLIDHSINKDISVHFVFTCPSSAFEFEAAAWLHNLLQDQVQHIGFWQNLGIAYCTKSNQEKILIACQVEPNAEHCQIPGRHPVRPLNMFFLGQL